MKFGIRARIVAAAAVVVAVVVIVVGQFVRSSSEAEFRSQARREGEELAVGFGSEVSSRLLQSKAAAVDVGATLLALKKSGVVDRSVLDAVHQRVLTARTDILASWSAWEPDALDGADAYFAGSPGYDATGRYVPYWNRGGGTVARDVLVDYTKPGPGDYYLIPRDTKAEKIIEPYVYPVAGKDVVMTSLTTPILDGETVLGVSGVDLDLSEVAKTIDGIRPLGGGSAVLVSTGGLVVAGLGQDKLGAELPSDSPIASVIEQVRSSSTPIVTEGKDPLDGSASYLAAVTIPLDGADSWVLVVSMPEAKALAGLHATDRVIWIATIVAVLVGAIALWVVGTSIARPVRRLTAAMNELAGGALEIEIPGSTRTDEIGQMAGTVEVFRQRLLERAEMEEQRQRAEIDASAARAAVAERTAETFERTMRDAVAGVTEGASVLEIGVHGMVAATEQLGSAVEDISRQAIETTAAAGSALAETARTAEVMRTLTDAAGAIGATVDLVESIAAQTNLLALNATIESARAGEAGRGFAVVAHEVKTLAEETARATQDIGDRIRAIQDSTAQAVEAIETIATRLGDVNRSNERMASDLADRNLHSSIVSVVGRSRSAAGSLLDTAGQLTRSADTLVEQVDQFGVEVRSAGQ